MTAVNGVNFAVADAPTPATVLATEKWGGRVKTLQDKYTALATVATGTLIKVGKMPKGAIPLGGSIRYSGASTGTLTFGYTGATSALGAATALATTKTQRLYPSATQWGAPLTAAQDIYATLAGHNLATGDILCVELKFAKD